MDPSLVFWGLIRISKIYLGLGLVTFRSRDRQGADTNPELRREESCGLSKSLVFLCAGPCGQGECDGDVVVMAVGGSIELQVEYWVVVSASGDGDGDYVATEFGAAEEIDDGRAEPCGVDR